MNFPYCFICCFEATLPNGPPFFFFLHHCYRRNFAAFSPRKNFEAGYHSSVMYLRCKIHLVISIEYRTNYGCFSNHNCITYRYLAGDTVIEILKGTQRIFLLTDSRSWKSFELSCSLVSRYHTFSPTIKSVRFFNLKIKVLILKVISHCLNNVLPTACDFVNGGKRKLFPE